MPDVVIRLKRVYDERVYDKKEAQDGQRLLVERLWRRGIRKAELQIEGWEKEAGPSNELRKWFSHEPAKWAEFQKRYLEELKKLRHAWQPMLEAAKRSPVTLLYSSHDTEHNNAVALKRFLEAKLKQLRSNVE